MIRLSAWTLIGGWVGAAAAQISPAQNAVSPSCDRLDATTVLLDQRLGQIAFEETPLDQALDWLSEQVTAELVVRWAVLEENGVSRDTPVTLKVHNVRFSQALWLIMGEVGGGDLRLGYRAEGELVILSTTEDLERELVTKIYDVGDLLSVVVQFPDCPQVDLTRIGQTGASTVLQSSGNAENGNDKTGDDSAKSDIDGLVGLIQGTVEPDSWKNNGGTGTIERFGNSLIVRNTIRVHQALAGYLVSE